MDPHEAYFRSLSREEQQLVALKEFLYQGSWEEIRRDLLARKEGKPYVLRLETRIDEDVKRIERLQAYELSERVNLAKFLPRSGSAKG
jgi:hypothetical protein